MQKERWKPWPSNAQYYISDQGRVYSKHVKRVLLQSESAGYMKVGTRINGKPKTMSVHTLVAETFIGFRPLGMIVRHLDGNSKNNAIGNLIYGTKSENGKDTILHGTHPFANRTHCSNGHKYVQGSFVLLSRRNGTERKCNKCAREAQARYRRSRI